MFLMGAAEQVQNVQKESTAPRGRRIETAFFQRGFAGKTASFVNLDRVMTLYLCGPFRVFRYRGDVFPRVVSR